MSDALDNAAAAALWNLREQSREHMGALYRLGGDFGHTDTVTGDGNTVSGKLSIPTGSLAALFHNHPRKWEAPNSPTLRVFSKDDKQRAVKLGVPSYITTPDGTVMKFDPSTNTTEEVLAEFPTALIEALRK